MNLKSGFPFWLIKHGLPYSYQKLSHNKKTHVLVVGGGITGALVAFQLQDAGIETCVVDARTIGLGSTCASTSLLQYEIDTPLHELIAKIGKTKAQKAYRLCEESINTLEQISRKIKFEDFERKKSLYTAHHPQKINFLKKELEARKQNGHMVSWLDDKEIQQKYKLTSKAGILSQTAAQTNAYLYAHALHQHSIKQGVHVYDRTNIAHFKPTGKRVKCITDEGFTINAKWVVFATGYEAIKYLDKPIVRLQSTYAIISEENKIYKNICNNTLIWNTANPYVYLRKTADGRVLIGGRDENFYDPIKRDNLLDKKASMLANDFSKMYNGLKLKTEFTWTGTFGSTDDGLPYIGVYPKMPYALFALGFGGNGITFSQIAADIITTKVAKGKDLYESLFGFSR